MQDVRTPPSTDLRPRRRGLMIAGRVVCAVAIALTGLTAYTAFWYASTDLAEGLDVDFARFAVGFVAILAVITWAGGLLLIRSSRDSKRPAWAMPLLVLLVVVVVAATALAAVLLLD